MDRRTFVKTSMLSTAFAAGCSNESPRPPDRIVESKSHVLTLSFDDGFKKSFLKIADIYDEFGLRACLNVIAAAHFPSFQGVDQWIRPELMGDFADWNSLVARGHEVMPHSWLHNNLVEQPLEKAEELIGKCLDYFEQNLEGYIPSNAVFNFPFNASNQQLETFALKRVRAVRSGGGSPVNPVPTSTQPTRLACWSHGPNNSDQWVQEQVNKFLMSDGGWLILNLHGLDDEGWGPISTNYLNSLLERLTSIERVEVLPAGEVLNRTTDSSSPS